VRSTAAAQALLKRLAAAPREPPPAPVEMVRVPAALLGPDRLGEMVTRNDHRAMDAYLYFLNLGLSTAAYTPVNREDLQTALGWPPRVSHRPQLSDLLKRMRDRYGLIDLTKEGKDDPAVRLRPLPLEGAVGLPVDYFRHGWDRRLPPPARMFLMMGLAAAQTSPIAPKFSLSREALAARHGTGAWAVGKGAVTLRRMDLLEVEHSEIPLDGGPRKPNVYLLNPFYDPAERAARLEALRERHGEAAVGRARKWAALVYEDEDAGLAEKLAELEARHGPAVVAEAGRVLGQKSPNNPKRNGNYLVGTIEGVAAKRKER
jgi:hypothetical protein